MDSVIDKDIAFYRGCLEIAEAKLLDSPSKNETKIRQIVDRYKDVLLSLQALRIEIVVDGQTLVTFV